VLRGIIRTCGIVMALGVIAVPSAAQGRGRGRSDAGGRDEEVRVIRAYFANTANLPPGLARREKLPPGLEKQLRRNGTLPPGLQKKATPLPADLERRLPALPSGHARVVVSDRVLVVEIRTQKIVDVLLVLSFP